MLIAGVNLRTSEKDLSCVAILDQVASVVHIATFHTDIDLMETLRQWGLKLVAIGSPLSMPLGLSDLEPSAVLERPSDRKGRQCERELAQVGISCFFTDKGAINRRQIYRSIELSASIRELGTEVIEVYPHATQVILFREKAASSRSPEVGSLKENLLKLMNELEPWVDNLDRGACNALLNAYVGTLHCRGDSEELGIPEEGLLVIPRLSR